MRRRTRDLLVAVAWLGFVAGVGTLLASPLGAGGVLANLVGPGSALLGGTVVVRRTEVPRLGWLLLAIAAVFPHMVGLGAFREAPDASTAVEVAHAALFAAPSLTLLPLVVLFPTGRAPSRLGRALLVAAVGVGVVEVLLGVPIALGLADGLELDAFHDVTDTMTFLTVVGAFVMHGRAFRLRPRVEQLQVKWFTLSLVSVGMIPASIVLDLGVDNGAITDGLSSGLVPLTIVLAITRYRLYEVERLISRTLAYAVVLGLLAAVFVGGVTGLTALVPAQDDVAVVVTTLVVMALFSPLLRRVRDVVDRRFDRSRYEARQVVEQFGRAIADVADSAEVHDRLTAVLGTTLAPATVAVWEPRPGAAR